MKDILCKHCSRFLFKQAGTVVIEGLICPGCKSKSNFKIIQADTVKDIVHKFTTAETPPKSKVITNEDAKPLKPEVS